MIVLIRFSPELNCCEAEIPAPFSGVTTAVGLSAMLAAKPIPPAKTSRRVRFPLPTLEVHDSSLGFVIVETSMATEMPSVLNPPEWAEREEIRSFAGHPLIFQEKLLGVIGLFSRRPLDEREFTWLGLFANHAAVAIANARAFEEVEKLQRQLKSENDYLQEQVQQGFEFGEILGNSHALQEVLQRIRVVAPTDSTVLIGGESGTGKELAARAIHELSRRRERALISVNCASIPRDLFESEFFGHVKGAFTGAVRDRIGRFQLADKGTLFLDEVGEIPFELQSKLLRVLQEGTFERVGEDRVRTEWTCVLSPPAIESSSKRLRQDDSEEICISDCVFFLCECRH